ncbi:hypothetical protein Riean_0323 [Riemerella anatipestifer ATCC 11845 = DSM 15868]|nr:hypothetical protein Riean_0323 [Riemerella anatipestifer ATCC 11845 = DSM 15868]SNV53853.1 Uncharacterised protein [Riemerella anatipestifer]
MIMFIKLNKKLVSKKLSNIYMQNAFISTNLLNFEFLKVFVMIKILLCKYSAI